MGFRCPCQDCERSDGRFKGKTFRAFTWHYGKYPFRFRFSCPAEGCTSVRLNRNGLMEHMKIRHAPEECRFPAVFQESTLLF